MNDYQLKYNTILFETLQYVIRFFNRHNIRYYIAYGSAIGAVRHHGLIPWDDDIDIVLFKEDYDRLFSLRDELRADGFRFVSFHDKGYYYAHSKIYNEKTTLWEKKERPFLTGVFVDIFPLLRTSLTDSDVLRSLSILKAKVSRCLLASYHYSLSDLFRWIRNRDMNGIRRFIKNKLFKLTYDWLLDDAIKYEGKLGDKNGDKVVSYLNFSILEKDIFDYSLFSSAVVFPFEDFSVNLPIGYDTILKRIYGDYMTPPPIEERVLYHGHLRYYINLNEGLSFAEVQRRVASGEKCVF